MLACGGSAGRGSPRYRRHSLSSSWRRRRWLFSRLDRRSAVGRRLARCSLDAGSVMSQARQEHARVWPSPGSWQGRVLAGHSPRICRRTSRITCCLCSSRAATTVESSRCVAARLPRIGGPGLENSASSSCRLFWPVGTRLRPTCAEGSSPPWRARGTTPHPAQVALSRVLGIRHALHTGPREELLVALGPVSSDGMS